MSRRAAMLASLFLLGLGLWVGIVMTSGRREAWDSPRYFTIALPLCVAAAGVAGFVIPGSAWAVGAALVAPQALALVLGSREIGSMWVGGLIFFLIFTAIFAAFAKAGSFVRGLRDGRRSPPSN